MDALQFNKDVIDEFRRNDGVCGGPFEGMAMILVTMTGARSGRQLCSPLVHSNDGGDPVIVAAQGGAPEHPNWYYNLVANPQITVEIGTDKWEGTAHLAEGDERRRLFDAQVAQIPQLAEYEKNAAPREIPVFRITRN